MATITAPIANIFVCVDCMIGDVSEGIALPGYRVNGNLFGADCTPNFDAETEEGMDDVSSLPCESCGDHLAGARYRYAVWSWS